jgi:hypothetical protein
MDPPPLAVAALVDGAVVHPAAPCVGLGDVLFQVIDLPL